MGKIKTLTLHFTTGSNSFEAAWEALSQYVDNNDESAETPKQKAQIEAAKTLIALFDGAHASLAE